MNLSLQGKNAVVCGGSEGIGFAIAQELSLAGATCILLARNEEKLKTAVAALDKKSGQAHTSHAIDFNNGEQTKHLIDEIVAAQTIHVLVNNSGGPTPGPITEADEEQFVTAFHQHLITNHVLAKAVMQKMKEENYGRIINVISTSVKVPLKNLGVSNTIRGAVASWAKTMANELGQYGITVNNILPGMTKTGRLDKLISVTAAGSGQSTEQVEASMLLEIPARRFGQPSEIAAVAAFLASPAAAYVNGASIPVDGGRTGAI